MGSTPRRSTSSSERGCRRLGRSPIVGRDGLRRRYKVARATPIARQAAAVPTPAASFSLASISRLGRFHPLGLASSTGKPVVLVNPYLQTASVLDEKEVMRFAKRRMAAINATKTASKIGIVVSTKPGQFQLTIAKELRNKLASQGKEAELIVLDEVTAIKLRNFTDAEAFISTACPRIAIDGLADLENPFLSILEAEIMLGDKRWEKSWGISYIERISTQDSSNL